MRICRTYSWVSIKSGQAVDPACVLLAYSLGWRAAASPLVPATKPRRGVADGHTTGRQGNSKWREADWNKRVETARAFPKLQLAMPARVKKKQPRVGVIFTPLMFVIETVADFCSWHPNVFWASRRPITMAFRCIRARVTSPIQREPSSLCTTRGKISRPSSSAARRTTLSRASPSRERDDTSL